MLSTIDATELAAGDLISKDYTVLLNPNQSIPAGAGATALQAFVNQGGPTWARSRTAPPPRATRASRRSTRWPPRPQRARRRVLDSGLDVHRRVRHGEPRGVGLRRRRVHLPRRDGQPDLRPGRRWAATRAPRRATPTPLKSLGFSRSATDRASSTGARPWSSSRSARAGRSDRPQPVLPVVEGGRRADRAQRPAVPDARRAAARPCGQRSSRRPRRSPPSRCRRPSCRRSPRGRCARRAPVTATSGSRSRASTAAELKRGRPGGEAAQGDAQEGPLRALGPDADAGRQGGAHVRSNDQHARQVGASGSSGGSTATT